MDKKNFAGKSITRIINETRGYKEPKAHFGKEIYVDFYYYDPARDEMVRKKKQFDSIKNKRLRKDAMEAYIREISDKLHHGWNPALEGKGNGLTTINQVLERYEKSLSLYQRKKTELSYRSRLNILREYINSQPYPPLYIYQLKTDFFVDFLDWLSFERDVTARTRNNYKGWAFSFCEWLIQRKYFNENPVSGIPKVQEGEKNRRALTTMELNVTFQYLRETDKHFLLAALFEYYTFIRPTELSHLKIGDISIKDECIFVSKRFSKNKRDGSVSLNRNLILLMVELDIFKHPSECYLFGKNFKPNTERIGPDQFNKRWKKLANKLKFDDKVKFYSLKDSGIRDLANEKGIVTARDQARHTDVSTTNKYLQGRDLKGPEGAKDFDGAFKV